MRGSLSLEIRRWNLHPPLLLCKRKLLPLPQPVPCPPLHCLLLAVSLPRRMSFPAMPLLWHLIIPLAFPVSLPSSTPCLPTSPLSQTVPCHPPKKKAKEEPSQTMG